MSLVDIALWPLRRKIRRTAVRHVNPTRAQLDAMQPFAVLTLGASNRARAKATGDLYEFAGAVLMFWVSDTKAKLHEAVASITATGIPAIAIEAQAANTTPGEFAKARSKYPGYDQPLVVVTHDWHKYRCQMLARKLGFDNVVFWCTYADVRPDRAKSEARKYVSDWWHIVKPWG